MVVDFATAETATVEYRHCAAWLSSRAVFHWSKTMDTPANRNERGYIALARGVLDHPKVGARKPYSYFEAWVWLLFEAAWKPRRIGVVNRHGAHTVVNLEGGQLSHSLRFMAKAWGWRSDFRVRTFLNRLKTSAQINAQTVAGQNVITICNYERYQNPEAARGSQSNAQISAQYTRNTRKEEERKKERIDHDASRQGTAEVVPIDEAPKAKLFRVGRTILVSLGISEKQSGAIIGRWLKQKNDPPGILAALEYAAANGVMEPVGYVTRCLAKDGKHEKLSLTDQARELADRARELENTAGFRRSPVAIGSD